MVGLLRASMVFNPVTLMQPAAELSGNEARGVVFEA